MAKQFDAIIIGTGQAGPALANRMNREGMRVAVLERKLVGGTCVNVGCVPTKALVASARAAYVARRAGEFGVNVGGPVTVDMAVVKERMKRISGESNKGVTGWLEGMDNVTLIRGHARFESASTVRVGDELLQSDKIFLNVGGRARAPSIPGLSDVDYLTNSSMMELDSLPKHLVVVGGGYIGLEFAQMYRRFGSAVTLVEMGPRVIGREDEEVSNAVQKLLEKEGVVLRLDAECVELRKEGSGFAVRVSCKAGDPDVVGSHLLLAVGRAPNTHEIDAEKAGLELDNRGYVTVDDQLRTNVPGIWALGDCNRRGAFTHTAYNDYEIAAANLFDDDPRRVSDRIQASGLFVDPPLGRIGMSEREARESGRRVLVGRRPMSRVGRARERSETDGFIKILVDAENKQILGATILGIGGDEVVQVLLPVMYAKAPYTVISRAVHIHPTVAELLPTVLQDLKPLS